MKTKPPAILILTPGFPANESDDNCLPAVQLFVKSLKASLPDIAIHVLSFQYPYKRGTYSWEGCLVTAFGGRNRAKGWRLLLWFRVWQHMKLLRKQYHLQSLLSFWLGETALLGKRFGERYKIPYYCWLQGQDAKKDNAYVRRVKAGSTSLIAISDFIARTLHEQHGIRPAYVIPLGVKAPLPLRNGQVRDIDIIAAGSLIPLKRYDVLLDVVNRVRHSFPELKVSLCGDGPEAGALTKKIAQLQLDEYIRLTGELPHGVLLRMMQRAKLFLHPSSYEGMSTVCLEALAAGAVVISFCQPMNESIPNWYVVHTPEEMAAKALDILATGDMQYHPFIPYPAAGTIAALSPLLLQSR